MPVAKNKKKESTKRKKSTPKTQADKLIERRLNKDPFAKAKRKANKTRLA